MFGVALVALAALTLSFVVARYFANRGNAAFGVVLGILPLAIMVIVLNWSVDYSIQSCLNSACASAGLPPGCTIAEFGCTEWSDLSRLLIYAAGAVSLVLYALGVGIMVIRRAWRGKEPPRRVA